MKIKPTDIDGLDGTEVANTPAGTVSATTVQAAINELDTEKVPTTRSISSGTGLTGGGNLSADRTLSIADTAVTPASYGDSTHVAAFTVDQKGRLTAASNVSVSFAGYVTDTRTLTAGAGLTGGGDLSANRTFDVGAGTGITVNANDVALDTSSTRNTDHAGVTITAGAGLTGGGDITTTRTLDVGAGTGITVNANDVAIPSSFITTGDYTPTFTGITNVSGITAFSAMYTRVGNHVIVTGVCNIDPTVLGTTQVDISLPIASTFTDFTDALGSATSANSAAQAGSIIAETSTGKPRLQFIATDVSNATWMFVFQYKIL